jgi:hypothetical protein
MAAKYNEIGDAQGKTISETERGQDRRPVLRAPSYHDIPPRRAQVSIPHLSPSNHPLLSSISPSYLPSLTHHLPTSTCHLPSLTIPLSERSAMGRGSPCGGRLRRAQTLRVCIRLTSVFNLKGQRRADRAPSCGGCADNVSRPLLASPYIARLSRAQRRRKRVICPPQRCRCTSNDICVMDDKMEDDE